LPTKKIKLINYIVKNFNLTPNLNPERDYPKSELFLTVGGNVTYSKLRSLDSVPYKLVDSNRFAPIETNPQSYRLIVEENQAKLVYVKTFAEMFDVVHFKPTTTYFSVEKREFKSKNVHDYWINDVAVPWAQLSEYLKSLVYNVKFGEQKKKKMNEKRLDFLTSALIDRLSYRFPTKIEMKLFDLKVESDVTISDINIQDEIFKLMEESLSGEEKSVDFFDESINLKTSMMDTSSLRLDTTTLLSFKPKITFYNNFFDDYINSLFENRVPIATLISSNKKIAIPESHSELDFMFGVMYRPGEEYKSEKLYDDINEIQEEQDKLSSIASDQDVERTVNNILKDELVNMFLNNTDLKEIDFYIKRRRIEVRSEVLKQLSAILAENSDEENEFEEEDNESVNSGKEEESD